MEISIPIAFAIGLFSATHCLGMCGSISSTLTLSLPAQIKSQPRHLSAFIAIYNTGRLLSYTLAGALVGLVGSGISDSGYLQAGHDMVRIITSLVVIAVGFYLTGWFPQLKMMDRLGDPIWRHLEPIGRRLLPVNRPSQALLFGLIWGWLPCGLVYYVLILTLSTGNALTGALCMLSFGLGTLPAIISIGFLTGWMTRLSNNRTIRQIVGLSLIILGLVWLMFGSTVL